jgi:hypothetical protein
MGWFGRKKKEEEPKEVKKAPVSKYRIMRIPKGRVTIDFGDGHEAVVSKRMWLFLDHLITRLCEPGLISHESIMRKILSALDDHDITLGFAEEAEEEDDGGEEEQGVAAVGAPEEADATVESV